MISIAACLAHLTRRLAGASETPGLDGQVLLGHVLGRPRAWLLAHPEARLSPAELDTLEQYTARLEQGEPLPYVLGHWEFYGLDFLVSPAVLIPRPETELLVEQALAWLAVHPGPRLAVDVGTGSGCIAVSLAVHAPGLTVVAVDISLAALRIVQANARRHGVASRVLCLQADLLPPFVRPCDLLAANLPYIPAGEVPGLRVSRWEPLLALSGGADGLDLISGLLAAAPGRVASGGRILLEIGASESPAAGQGPAVAALARAAFPSASVQVLPDLAGKNRLVLIDLDTF